MFGSGLIPIILGVAGLLGGIVWLAFIAKAGDKKWLWVALGLLLVSFGILAMCLPMVDVITKVSSGQGDD